MPRKRLTNKHLPKYMVFSHGAYYYKRKNVWIFLSRNYSEALKKYAEVIGDPGKLSIMYDLFRRYEVEAQSRLKASSCENIKMSLKNLGLIFGEMRPCDVRSTDIYRYLDHRAKKSQDWANKDKSTLNQVFISAIRWGVIEHNPCRDVKGFSRPPRTRLILQDEFDLVYNLGSDLIKNAMLFAYYTKARQGDVLKVKFEDIQDGYLRIKANKTGKELLIKLSAKLSGLIAKIKSEKKIHSFYLFSTGTGSKYTPDGFKSIWQRTMDKAMESGLKERFTFHDIRAKAITHTADEHGIDEAVKGSGNSSKKMTDKTYCRSVQKVEATE